MAKIDMPPTSATTSGGELTGSLSDVDDDPYNPDSNWMVATGNNVDTYRFFTFDTPPANPTIGTDLQEIVWQARQYDETQSGTPNTRVDIYEGALLLTGTEFSVSASGPHVFTFKFNASILNDSTGVDLRVRFWGLKTGGSPTKRNTVDLGAIKWICDYPASGPILGISLNGTT